MKILLVQPDSGHHVGFKHMALTEPLGPETIAACLSEHEVRILDLRVDSDLQAYLRTFRPEAVGVAVPFTTAAYQAQKVLHLAKEYDSKIFAFAGGHHATLSPSDFLTSDKGADAVVIGEGESTLPELLAAFEKGQELAEVEGIAYLKDGQQIFTASRQPMSNLDSSPTPARNLTEKYREKYFYKSKKPVALVETTRGCPYRCKFCSVWKFHQGKYRSRSPERVIEELLAVENEQILFADDNFLENVRRAERIYEAIKKMGLKKRFGFQARTDTIASHPQVIKKWREIGLDWVLVGFESFEEGELNEFNKHTTVEANEQAVHILQDNNIEIQAAFIVSPSYGKREFNLLTKYIKKMRLVSPQITILTPLPGTDFFKEKWNELTTRNYELFDFLHAVLPTKLPLEEFYKQFCKLYRRVSLGVNIKSVFSAPFSHSFKDIPLAVKVFNEFLRPKAYLKAHRRDNMPEN